MKFTIKNDGVKETDAVTVFVIRNGHQSNLGTIDGGESCDIDTAGDDVRVELVPWQRIVPKK